MKQTARLLQQIKMYYDIGCPSTWASLKVLKQDINLAQIDFRPVSDYKINLERNKYLSENEIKDQPRADRNRVKDVSEHLQHELKHNWTEVYAESRQHGSILPMLFLTSIREHFPSLYIAAIYRVGSRLWEEALPVHKGCYLSICAREIGLQFRDSEEIISRLSHRNYKKMLTDFSKEAVKFGAVESPYLIDTQTSPIIVFKDATTLVNQCFSIPHEVVV